MILSLLWIQYLYLSTASEATLMLLALIPAIFVSHILTNRWLPKAVQKKRMRLFILQFIGTTLLIAFILAGGYQCLRWAESNHYFPHSILLADDNTLSVDFLFAIPSVVVINFGFCGLRFFFEHIKLQKAHLEMQLQVLQSQINPHFMFNVLNHIHVVYKNRIS